MSEVARKIFAELETCLGTITTPTIRGDGKICAVNLDGLHIRFEDYETIKKKYTEGQKMAYICSPYRASDRASVAEHKEYARRLVKWAIEHGYTPICPHLYLTEVLNDENPEEREKGRRLGLELLAACDLIIVGSAYGISEGMLAEMKEADGRGITFHEVYKIT